MVYVFGKLDLIREVLKKPRFGLITDVDGTISRTTSSPDEATVSPKCRHYLTILCRKLTLIAAISGRPATQIKEMIGIDGMVYLGNHGLERLGEGDYELAQNTKDYSQVIKTVLKELTPSLSGEGIIIEDKGITASIHYRLCLEPESVMKRILTAVKSLPQARSLQIMEGKMVINLLPDIGVNKGTATLKLIKSYNLEGGIYIGDDNTDIDAFKAIHTPQSDFQGLAIGVISKEMPQDLTKEADLTLNGVADVERFLGWMSEELS